MYAVIDKPTNKTSDIGFREFRENADEYIKRVNKGESFLVKRKSQKLFRIVPVEEEVWTTVVDFRSIDKSGVPLDDVMKALIELENHEATGRG
jgi:antitoxin (DNA-binding transcriptional repressor) of toxin-antitoxin stability system